MFADQILAELGPHYYYQKLCNVNVIRMALTSSQKFLVDDSLLDAMKQLMFDSPTKFLQILKFARPFNDNRIWIEIDIPSAHRKLGFLVDVFDLPAGQFIVRNFTSAEGGSSWLLVMMMLLDLGPDIPNWKTSKFGTTCANAVQIEMGQEFLGTDKDLTPEQLRKYLKENEKHRFGDEELQQLLESSDAELSARRELNLRCLPLIDYAMFQTIALNKDSLKMLVDRAMPIWMGGDLSLLIALLSIFGTRPESIEFETVPTRRSKIRIGKKTSYQQLFEHTRIKLQNQGNADVKPSPVTDNPKEIILRKALASNLDLIQPGLQLIKEEFVVENPIGASGKIDILARSKEDMIVPIELKRSDQAARHAIHEINKYIALLKETQGVEAHKLRAIVVSTDWHELTTPFLNFKDQVDWEVIGLKLILDQNGMPEKCLEVIDDSEAAPYALAISDTTYLFKTEKLRDESAHNFAELLILLGHSEFVILKLNCSLPLKFQYSFIPAVMTLPAADSSEVIFSINDFEEDVLTKLSFYAKVKPERTEHNDRRTFNHHLGFWKPAPLIRSGNLTSSLLRTDPDIIKMFSGIEGDNPACFTQMSSPRFKSHWDSFCESSLYCLTHNLSWRLGVKGYLDHLAQTSPNCSVSLRVQSTNSILHDLFYYRMLNKSRSSDESIIPRLDMTIEHETGSLTNVEGIVVWDRKTHPENPIKVIGDLFGNDFVAHKMIGMGTPLHERKLLKWLGLEYILFEKTTDKDVQLITTSAGATSFDPFDAAMLQSLDDFLDQHSALFDEIYSMFHFFIDKATGHAVFIC
ncbi:DUF91 domain-containing protein [Candidatus Obscuribacterales bacterium]|nr:DUF91 domain-containing protein [Candidatus Obscuribacterales bacterium]